MKTMNHPFHRISSQGMTNARATFMAACTVVFLLSASLSSADALLTEDFLSSDGYADGAALKNQTLTGPYEFTGNWSEGTRLLKYHDSANLGHVGGGVSIDYTAGASLRNSSRSLSPTYQFDSSTSAYYVSFKMHFSTVTTTGEAFTGIRHADGSGFAFGLVAGVKDGNYAMFNRDASGTHAVVDLGVAYTTGTHLFVIKLDDGGDGNWDTGTDQISIWIDPSDFSSEVAATTSSAFHTTLASTSGAGSAPLDTLTLSTRNFQANATIGFDHIILATDWDSVVVIPKP